tara:strand:+ start:930 stop:1112 length:183 start_codon:yes stop_codon:yes gene_type:complete
MASKNVLKICCYGCKKILASIVNRETIMLDDEASTTITGDDAKVTVKCDCGLGRTITTGN